MGSGQDWSLLWVDTAGATAEIFKSMEPWHLINHFPGLFDLIARKSRLYRSIQRVRNLLPHEYAILFVITYELL